MLGMHLAQAQETIKMLEAPKNQIEIIENGGEENNSAPRPWWKFW
jgi:hypothetical protein